VLSAAAYAGMFVFGIVMALLGAILPLISSKIGIGLGGAGGLFFAMNLAMLVTMLSLGPLMDRFGKKPALVAGPFLVAAALALFAGAASYRPLAVASALMGIGGGALNGGTNTLVSDIHTDPGRRNSALNVLGIFLGFGALFVPFLIGSLVGTAGLERILLASAALAVLPGLLAVALRFPAPRRREGVSLADVARFARNPLVLLFAFLLFFESGNEFILGGYTATYLTRELGIPIEGASYLLALYWAALLVARVVSSRLLLRVNGSVVVLASALAAALGVGFLLVSSGYAGAAAALLVTGFGFASIFPTTLGLAGSAFEAYSGTVFGILFAVALTGGMTLPWAVGQLGQSWGLRAAMALACLDALAIAALQLLISRRIKAPAGVRE
jgi:fucose permease